MSEDNHENHDGDLGNLNLNPFKDMLDTVANSIILPFQQVVTKVREAVIGGALEQFQKTIQAFGKALQALVDPDISDEEIQRRISSYQASGRFAAANPVEALFTGPRPCYNEKAPERRRGLPCGATEHSTKREV